MPPTDKSLGDLAFETAAKGYRFVRGEENLPPNERIYMESVVDQRRDPITEKSFSPEELDVIRNVITRRYDAVKPQFKEQVGLLRANAAAALKNASATRNPEARRRFLNEYQQITADVKGLDEFLTTGRLTQAALAYGQNYDVKPNIQYKDYKDRYAVKSPNVSGSDLETQIGQVLGRFSYDVDPQGNLTVAEDYDFNPLGKAHYTSEPIGVGDFFRSPKTVARKYAGKYLPPGQGRPVNIRVNSLAPPKAKAKEPTNWFSRTATALGF
jgi:hypothetical protein